jgi:hypothetical protein
MSGAQVGRLDSASVGVRVHERRPSISVVIPAYNAWGTLPVVLEALAPQVRDRDRGRAGRQWVESHHDTELARRRLTALLGYPAPEEGSVRPVR